MKCLPGPSLGRGLEPSSPRYLKKQQDFDHWKEKCQSFLISGERSKDSTNFKETTSNLQNSLIFIRSHGSITKITTQNHTAIGYSSRLHRRCGKHPLGSDIHTRHVPGHRSSLETHRVWKTCHSQHADGGWIILKGESWRYPARTHISCAGIWIFIFGRITTLYTKHILFTGGFLIPKLLVTSWDIPTS